MLEDHSITLREADAADEPTLWLILIYAASMTPPGAGAIADAKNDRYLCTYVDGWGGFGDLGVVAVADGEQPVGAAWLRQGREDHPFKLRDALTPELATAVLPEARGRGVGTLMMKRLIVLASPKYSAIVLSVREANRASDFYRRLGFREMSRMENRVGGVSLVMKLELSANAARRGGGPGGHARRGS
jgi:ribosomal protein S18 acetylase RimI-like enzyme